MTVRAVLANDHQPVSRGIHRVPVSCAKWMTGQNAGAPLIPSWPKAGFFTHESGQASAKLLAMSHLQQPTVVYEIRVKGRGLVRTTQLTDAQWAVRAAAEAGEGAKIVDVATGQVIERHPPRRS
jgi:hypothetical protein